MIDYFFFQVSLHRLANFKNCLHSVWCCHFHFMDGDTETWELSGLPQASLEIWVTVGSENTEPQPSFLSCFLNSTFFFNTSKRKSKNSPIWVSKQWWSDVQEPTATAEASITCRVVSLWWMSRFHLAHFFILPKNKEGQLSRKRIHLALLSLQIWRSGIQLLPKSKFLRSCAHEPGWPHSYCSPIGTTGQL